MNSHTEQERVFNENIERFERKIYDLKNLIGLGISLASNLNFASLVESILYSCIGQVFVEKVAILLQVDIDVSNFYIHMTKGYDTVFDSGEVILKDDSKLLKYLHQNSNAHEIETLTDTTEIADDLKKIGMLFPKIIIPMKSKNSLNGILILGEKITGEKFSIHEKEFLQDLAKFAAIAVENSRLYLMATLDRMTRLYIHHFFQERLEEEMKRSARSKTPLTLIMSDIDHFKKFNDSYGHQQGDIVLKETAKLFKQQIRSIDIPARYGGEEFAIILPETSLDNAMILANRLRKVVEEHEFPGQDHPLHVTISIGIAEFNPGIDKEKKDLIQRTDSALYDAKHAGRNRVIASKTK